MFLRNVGTIYETTRCLFFVCYLITLSVPTLYMVDDKMIDEYGLMD
jgi:hypothetical protein